ncbi:hypothetical protein PSTT_02097 [Puccinia striiformis]|uniref:Glycosyl transferase CAP10 domain-containing protein n=1 Tax=Puccinia striiformis TaxID=27350 RepID=A0A2S4W195_9BASI|nr:hypothetical protein PSTT_02097 [Puccinia striiformis]
MYMQPERILSPPFAACSPVGSTGKKKAIKPPPISMIPSLRNHQAQPMSISSILNPNQESNSAGRRLESEERTDWNTGLEEWTVWPSDSILPFSVVVVLLLVAIDSGIDLESNLICSVQMYALKNIIKSERTERTITSTMTTSWKEKDMENAKRQINKRNQKMIKARDQIVHKLIENPNDPKLVRDLGKLYLRFNEPNNQQDTAKSEPSLKLAIHYLEQSIQIDNRDPLTWLFLGRAWSLLLRYPSEEAKEVSQRISNSSLAFRKAIHISTSTTNNIRQSNRFRLAYVEHLEELSNYNEAASVLQDGLTEDENDIECWWELGRMMEKWTSPDLGERIQRLEHACLAYQKASVLQPDDHAIRLSLIDAQRTLESLKSEQDHDNKQDPSTIQIPSNTSISDLKKLVSDLPEIPEFNNNKNHALLDQVLVIQSPKDHHHHHHHHHQIETLIESVNSPSTSSGSHQNKNNSPKNLDPNSNTIEPAQLSSPLKSTTEELRLSKISNSQNSEICKITEICKIYKISEITRQQSTSTPKLESPPISNQQIKYSHVQDNVHSPPPSTRSLKAQLTQIIRSSPLDHSNHSPPPLSGLKKPSSLLSPLSKQVQIGSSSSPPPPAIPPRPSTFRTPQEHTRQSVDDQEKDRTGRSSSTNCAGLSPTQKRDHSATFNPHLGSPLNLFTNQQQQQQHPYNYSLIDAHLQSIIEIDQKRKQDLKQIKKQIRLTDQWAESRRRSVIEELRRVCTPVNNSTMTGGMNEEDSPTIVESSSRDKKVKNGLMKYNNPDDDHHLSRSHQFDRLGPAGYAINGEKNKKPMAGFKLRVFQFIVLMVYSNSRTSKSIQEYLPNRESLKKPFRWSNWATSEAIKLEDKRAEKEWKTKLAKTSKTLPEAIQEYKRRYNQAPPYGFEKWWDYVVQEKVILRDEYDQINTDLKPFLAIEPSDLTHRSIVMSTERPETFTLTISKPKTIISGGEGHLARAKDLAKLIDLFGAALPENSARLNLTFTKHDQPAVQMTYSRKQKMIEMADAGEYFSPSDYIKPNNPKLSNWANACPTTSALYLNESGSPSSSSSSIREKGKSFILDHSEAMQICDHPEFIPLHGFTSASGTDNVELVPLFTFAKTTTQSDILVTPLEQYSDTYIGKEPDWSSKKKDKLLWRGSTTGAEFAAGVKWENSQRARLHIMGSSDRNRSVMVLSPDDHLTRLISMDQDTLNKDLLDVSFSGGPVQCDPVTCDFMHRNLKFAGTMGLDESYQYKYLIDVDGNGWSGRFHRLMSTKSLVLKSTIFPEWYSDRIQPWVHYVPIKVDYSELSVIRRLGDKLGAQGRVSNKGHDELAEKIASQGKRWAAEHWRRTDMAAYMFRLILEWRRVMLRGTGEHWIIYS